MTTAAQLGSVPKPGPGPLPFKEHREEMQSSLHLFRNFPIPAGRPAARLSETAVSYLSC